MVKQTSFNPSAPSPLAHRVPSMSADTKMEDGVRSTVVDGATPSVTSGSSISRDGDAEPRKKARRTFLTPNACMRCRQKKSKCDGRRPTCGRCEKQGVESCSYDVAQEGITRMQNLQILLDSRTAENGRMSALIDILRRGTDQEATTVLARLRLGESIDTLLASVGGMRSPVSQQSDASVSTIQRSLESLGANSGEWTSWGERCDEPDGERSSRSSMRAEEAQDIGHPFTDGLGIRERINPIEPREYYQRVAQDLYPRQERNPSISSSQYTDIPANIITSSSPYFVGQTPEQSPTGQTHQNYPFQRGGAKQPASRYDARPN